jgi:DNA repair exonuclease SbcCD nuclease subunit
MSARDVLVAHTSDVHVGSDIFAGGEDQDPLRNLRRILAAAEQVQVLLVAGDLFDNNRLPLPLLEATAELLDQATPRVVILPGNHDPLTPDSVYHRGPFAEVENVTVLGLFAAQRGSVIPLVEPGRSSAASHAGRRRPSAASPGAEVPESVIFPELDLEVWGRAHRDYGDMPPFADPPPRTTRWRIALAHGHFEPTIDAQARWWPSWRFRPQDLAAAGADYVALGHWNRSVRVGDGQTLAYYSGSPDLAGSVNLVRLGADGQVSVTPRALGPYLASL